jgi:hypothetical protein
MDALNDFVSLDQDYSRLQIYHVRNPILIRYLCLALIGLAGVLVNFIIGFWRWRYVVTHFGPAVLWRWMSPLLWIGIGLLFVGSVGLYLLIHASRQEIQLSPMGITWKRGRNLSIVRWDEIETIHITSIQYGILNFTWASRTEAVLHDKKGKRLKINQTFEHFDKLVETIKHYVYPLMFEEFRENFNQGKPMKFGPLILTSQGVINGRKALPWHEIGKIQLHSGRLDLLPTKENYGNKFSIPAHKIPNIDLCVQILQHFGPQI